jgi:hypothetical protein
VREAKKSEGVTVGRVQRYVGRRAANRSREAKR